MENVPSLTLRDGNQMPLLAFGTGTAWFKEDEKAPFDADLVELTRTAIDMGFHHLDCAEMYGTEEEVGEAIKQSGIDRKKLFITSKVADGINDIPQAFKKSLQKLQTDYLDLYLIHIPFFAKNDGDLQRAWSSMEELKRSGKIKSIGVSNYLRPDLEATLKTAQDPPVMNQLEYHPYLQRANDYVPWMRSQGVQVAAFKPLTPVAWCPEGPLKEPLERMAKAHGTTPTAILLSWYIHDGIVAVTTTRKASRLQEYGAALKVKLTDQEADEISRVGLTKHFRNAWGEKFADDDRS